MIRSGTKNNVTELLINFSKLGRLYAVSVLIEECWVGGKPYLESYYCNFYS